MKEDKEIDYEEEELQEPVEYTIRITSNDGSAGHSIHLSQNWVRYGVVSLVALVMLLTCAFSYAIFSSYTLHNERNQIEKLREANAIQQEQLLQLSKKANSLQNEVDQLGQVEYELRQITGVQNSPASAGQQDNAGDAKHDGQGGPYKELTIEDVSKAYENIANMVAIRKASLQQLKEAMRTRGAVFSAQLGQTSYRPSIWPASGDVSSPYGLRWNGSDFHPGIDIANDIGTPILATADGTVTDAGWNSGGYGNMVDIDHGNGYVTRYAHASQVVVVAGQTVKQGQVIAYMGSTGNSTGPHVHYEVIINGQAVNPAGYL